MKKKFTKFSKWGSKFLASFLIRLYARAAVSGLARFLWQLHFLLATGKGFILKARWSLITGPKEALHALAQGVNYSKHPPPPFSLSTTYKGILKLLASSLIFNIE
jgi:hypothetical protein